MFPSDFNDLGQIVGNAVSTYEHGWYWSERTGTVDLRQRIPSCLEQWAAAINASGAVAGTHCAPGPNWLHPFVWSLQGGFRDLDVGGDIHKANGAGLAINDGGSVAGWLDLRGNSAPRPTLWPGGGAYIHLPVLPADYPWGSAYGINTQGVVVGFSSDLNTYTPVPMAWPSPRTFIRLDGDGVRSGAAMAINDAGVVVGYGQTAAGTRALLWRLPAGTGETSPVETTQLAGDPPAPVSVTGPSACFVNLKTLTSRAALADCVMARQ